MPTPTAEKHHVCQSFVIRLHDDRVPVAFYAEEAIGKSVPLFADVGSSEVDRNSITNLENAKAEMDRAARERVREVKRVAQKISTKGYGKRTPPWTGVLHFEDISGDASFELVETVVRTGREDGLL